MKAAARNPVGRPRSFDEEQVLLTVMNVFWEKGYEATSMQDILAATGLHKGSIYQAFGDKHSLFIRALRAYIDNMRRSMKRILGQASSGLDGLRAVLHDHIDLGAGSKGAHYGCLALNSLVETAQHDPEVMNTLKTAFQMRLRLISEGVRRAQAEGNLRSDWKAERITRVLMAGEAGALVQLKGPVKPVQAKAMIDDLLAAMA